jgi:hypothetical protein
MKQAERLVQTMLGGYKRLVSPLLPPACRYVPTCSEYAAEAVVRHGIVRGAWLAAGRVLRCQPWGGAGYDPVPYCRPRQAAEAEKAGKLEPAMAHGPQNGPHGEAGQKARQGRTHQAARQQRAAES